MTQMKGYKKDLDWKDRIVGTKAIAQPATFVVEVVPNKKNFTTNWIIHKARYGQTCKVVTGFRHGLIVPLDEKFKKWVEPRIKHNVLANSILEKLVKNLNQISDLEPESEQ